MPAAATHHRPMQSQACEDGLEVLGGQLRGRGWTARVVYYHVGGDLDVRLDVRGPGSPAVELLGECGGLISDDRWQAVHLTTGGRTVWCGPPHDHGQAELIVFIEDLLRRDENELAEHYLRLG